MSWKEAFLCLASTRIERNKGGLASWNAITMTLFYFHLDVTECRCPGRWFKIDLSIAKLVLAHSLAPLGPTLTARAQARYVLLEPQPCAWKLLFFLFF